MTHHPHVHMIVPGGGLSADGTKWIACRKNFFLSVRVLSRLYRRLILEGLARLHDAGKLQFFGDHADLADRAAFDAIPQTAAQNRLGGLRQGTLRRTQSRAGISVALHAPGRDLQQPPDPDG